LWALTFVWFCLVCLGIYYSWNDIFIYCAITNCAVWNVGALLYKEKMIDKGLVKF